MAVQSVNSKLQYSNIKISFFPKLQYSNIKIRILPFKRIKGNS